MMDGAFWTRFLVVALASWRVTHLLAREDGPWDIVVRLRRWLADGFWGHLIDCFYCLSLWTAAPAAVLVTTALPDVVLIWLALSGSVCLLERIGEPPLKLEPIGPAQEGRDHGMLRTEAGGSERSSNGVSIHD